MDTRKRGAGANTLRSACLLAVLFSAGIARAAAPPFVPVQGVLTDSAGNPLNGAVSIRFSIYDSNMGGTALWTELQSIQLDRGLFTAYLGQVQPLDLGLFRDRRDLWLAIQVEGSPEGPRVYLGSVPFSAFSEHGNYAAGSGILLAGNVISSTLGTGIDGSEIEDGTVTGNDVATGSLSGVHLADATITRAKLAGDGCGAGQVLKWNGSGWDCAADDAGAISCNWTGWRYSGPQGTDCTGAQPGYYCLNFPCLRINCQAGRITQIETATCPDAYDPGTVPWCPFFYSWDGKDYRKDTTILYRLDGAEKETVQQRSLKHLRPAGQVKAKIVEEEPEISYVDAIRLLVVDSRGSEVKQSRLRPIWASRGLDELLQGDGTYLVLHQGEEVYLIFEPPASLEDGWERSLLVEAEGYYRYLDQAR